MKRNIFLSAIALFCVLPVLAIDEKIKTYKKILSKLQAPSCPGNIDKMNCQEAVEIKEYVSRLHDTSVEPDNIVLRCAKKFGVNVIKAKSLRTKIEKTIKTDFANGEALLDLSEDYINFGEVKKDKGLIYGKLVIRNKGNATLTLTSLKALCKCTRVSIDSDGKKSGYFGTEGSLPGFTWNIKPGQEATLNVEFNLKDPSVNYGRTSRYISIKSNDVYYPEMITGLTVYVQ